MPKNPPLQKMNSSTLGTGLHARAFNQCKMHLEEPKTRKQLRGFIGMINYYREMWRHCLHILAPLISLTSVHVPWKWGEEQSRAFKEAKDVLSTNVCWLFSYSINCLLYIQMQAIDSWEPLSPKTTAL
jgi:hypothetical protein